MSFTYIPANTSNYTKNRAAYSKVTEITIHHAAGNNSVEELGRLWQNPSRNGSSHYGVQHGSIAQYVKEEDIAWTNSSWAANCRAITIETANSGGAPNWPVADDTLQTLIRLVADIAERRGLYPLVPGKNLTWHSMYTATTCPGPYLKSKFQYIADEANKIIKKGSSGGGSTPSPDSAYKAGDRLIFSTGYKTSTDPNSKALHVSTGQLKVDRGIVGNILTNGAANPIMMVSAKDGKTPICWCNKGDIRGRW